MSTFFAGKSLAVSSAVNFNEVVGLHLTGRTRLIMSCAADEYAILQFSISVSLTLIQGTSVEIGIGSTSFGGAGLIWKYNFLGATGNRSSTHEDRQSGSSLAWGNNNQLIYVGPGQDLYWGKGTDGSATISVTGVVFKNSP